MPQKMKLQDLSAANFLRKRTHVDQQFIIHEFVFVSFFDQLQELFNIDEIYRNIYNPYESFPGVYSSFWDGTSYKSNCLFEIHPFWITNLPFNDLDENQLCNPVASCTHNIVFVYFSLAYLSLQFPY